MDYNHDREVIIPDEVRKNVEEDLVMLKEIKDPELRKGVIEAWSASLVLNGFTAVHDIQGSGIYNCLVLKEGSQADHLNTVARIALGIAKGLLDQRPYLKIDLDLVVAGALLHDVGKPPEYNLEKRKFWTEHPEYEGFPPVSHAMYGFYICMLVGLPMRVAHIPATHCQEGEMHCIQRSIESTIVHTADWVSWDCFIVLKELDTSYPFVQPRIFPGKEPGET